MSAQRRIRLLASSREDDMVCLDILRRAAMGESYGSISRSLGRPESYARTLAARIRDSDLEESGEPPEAVLRFYWVGGAS